MLNFAKGYEEGYEESYKEGHKQQEEQWMDICYHIIEHVHANKPTISYKELIDELGLDKERATTLLNRCNASK
jgi:flagellar biosynthesis/type III secretory pathway protein FliH